MAAPTVLGVVASPRSGGRTATAVTSLLVGAAASGARTSLVELADTATEDVLPLIDAADAVVFGSPVYRTTYSSQLKGLLEKLQRGRHGETAAPLRGTAAAIVMTGASGHHFLATDGLRAVLSSFFAVQTLAPALYLDDSAFTEDMRLTGPVEALARGHGAALVDLAEAVRGSAQLRAMEPLV